MGFKQHFPKALLILGATLAFDAITCRIPGPGYLKTKKMEVVVPWQIPIGTDYSKVVTFLDAQNLEHSGHSPHEGTLPFPPVVGIVRNTSWTALIACDFQMQFTFDWKGKLTDYKSERIFTGP